MPDPRRWSASAASVAALVKLGGRRVPVSWPPLLSHRGIGRPSSVRRFYSLVPAGRLTHRQPTMWKIRCRLDTASSSSSSAAAPTPLPQQQQQHQASSRKMHREMQTILGPGSTLGPSSPLPPPPPRINWQQALINAALSFVTVLLAAQSFKSARAREKALRQLEETQQQMEQQRQRWRQLCGLPTTAGPTSSSPIPPQLAEACVQALRRQQQQQQQKSLTPVETSSAGTKRSGGWWWASPSVSSDPSPHSASNNDEDPILVDRLTQVLQTELRHWVGEDAWTEEEKAQQTLRSYLKSNVASKARTAQGPVAVSSSSSSSSQGKEGEEEEEEKEDDQEPPVEVVIQRDAETGTTIVKRKIFSM